MTKLYINKQEIKKDNKKDDLIIMLLELVVSAVTLMLASAIFKNIYVENIIYALLTALIISILNATIKPILTILVLPGAILSWGLLYPLVNVIILKLASVLMGNAFIVTGWILPFFISIFISITTWLLNMIFVKPYIEGR